MLKTQVVLFFAFMMLLAAGCAGPAPIVQLPRPATFTIEGTLTDTNDKNVQDALIVLLEEREDGWKPHYGQSRFTGPNGKFSPLTGVADGNKRYQLAVYSNPYEIRYPHDESLFEAHSEQEIVLSKDGSSFQPKSQQRITLTAKLPSEKRDEPQNDDPVVMDLRGDPNRESIVRDLKDDKLPEHLKEKLHGKKIAFVQDSKDIYGITIDGTDISIKKYTIPSPSNTSVNRKDVLESSTRKDKMVMPADLLGRLKAAAETKNLTKLTSSLEEVGSLGSEGQQLAEQLQTFIRNSDMAAILQLLSEVQPTQR